VKLLKEFQVRVRVFGGRYNWQSLVQLTGVQGATDHKPCVLWRIDRFGDLIFRQEGAPRTNQSVLIISIITGIRRSSVCRIITIFSQPPIHAKETNVHIWLLMYSRVV